MKLIDAATREPNFRSLPSIDQLLRTETISMLLPIIGVKHLTQLARTVVDSLRAEIGHGKLADSNLLSLAAKRLFDAWESESKTGLRRVINATGVVIHTNLGRAPLSVQAKNAVENAAGYCTLEYDIETGRRGGRGQRAESLIAELTGAEAAVIVNNCAAAAFLVLSVLASGGEVLVSRGELVEIGGDFRIPDVLIQSGAALREVGTTNRTKLADYEKAFNENTRMILRVHPSNYRIVGFTSIPTISELSNLAHKHGTMLFEDIGSGALVDLSQYGLTDEPVVSDSIRDGADIVAFSGDKLLGGPQSGIIAGRRELIDKIRKHPLYRVLRVDKLAYAALEATLESYRRGTAIADTPVLKMLGMTKDEVGMRTAKFVEALGSNLRFEITDGQSAVGGGAAPLVQPETVLLALSHETLSANEIGAMLRKATPPVIARIEDNKVLLDLRTVCEDEETELLKILANIN